MKRKSPFNLPIQNKCNSKSEIRKEENSSDDLSSKEAVTTLPYDQRSEKVTSKKIIRSKLTSEQFMSAVNSLGLYRKQLDKETWRLNGFTSSEESVWNRLISKLKLRKTEPIRHSLYNFWQRNSKYIGNDLFENQIDSNVEDNTIKKTNELDLPSLNPEIKPLTSIATIPYPATRAAVQDQLIQLKIIETSFILSFKQWREIYDSSTRDMKSDWTDVVYDKVCSCNFRCPLIFQSHHITCENTRKKNSSFFRCLAICKSASCERLFEIFIRDEPVRRDSIVFRVRVIGDENHSADEKPVARHLTGKNRFAVGKAASAVGPLKVFQEKVEKADEKMLIAGNFTGCETPDVIKHAVVDYRKYFQLDEDIYRECRMRQEILEDTDVTSLKIKGYVQVMGEKPFRLHLTSERQTLRYTNYCAKSKYSHVYVDATGSIVKSLPHQKTVLLYAAVFKDGNDPSNVIPLGHAILADHTATSISYFLGNLRQNIVTLKDKVVRPSFFVTDFSPAIFNAILQSFNQEDIRSHLKRCWNVTLRKYDAKELRSRSFLRFCCSHMMHAFARSLSAANVAKKIRKSLLHVFALFINCGELELSFKFLKRVLHMFGNPHATDAESILQSFLEAPYDSDDVPEKIGPCDFEVQEDLSDPLDEVDENMHSSKAIIHESPFNIEAIRRFPQLSELLDSKTKYENVTNPLFCRRVIYVFYKWFAYLPLWTSLLTDFEDRYSNDRTSVNIEKYETGRLSNAQIESYFDILKNSVFEKKTNLRPAHVIISLYRTVQIQLKADEFGVCQLVKNRKGKAKDMNVIESWGKKKAQKKPRNVHFSRIDKYNEKRFASKAIDLTQRKISLIPELLSPRPESFSPRPESFTVQSEVFSPKSEPIHPHPKVVSPKSQPSVFDTLGFISNPVKVKCDYTLDTLTTSALPHHSGSFSSSKSAESFCGRNFSNEQDFVNDAPLASISVQPMSQLNIFSAIEYGSRPTTFPDLKQTKSPIKSEIKGEYGQNEQETHKNQNINATRKNTHNRLPYSHMDIETFDSSPVRQSVTIDQCSLTWPAFSIKEKHFAGRSCSVTNTCNIDSPLFILYTMFRTESNIKSVISKSDKEPFLSLRKTFELVDSEGWDEARLYWLMINGLLSPKQFNYYNSYGSVDGNALRFIKSYLQLYESRSICSQKDCPMRERKTTSTEIALEHWETHALKFSEKVSSRCGVFKKTVNEISFEEATRLGHKRYTRKVLNIESNAMEEEDGWLCNGKVLTEPSHFVHGPPPLLFVDVLHPTMNDPNSEGIVQGNLNFHDIQRTVMIGSSTYTLRATINHNADHFTATILDSTHRLFLYNDLVGVEPVDQCFLRVETAVYVLKS